MKSKKKNKINSRVLLHVAAFSVFLSLLKFVAYLQTGSLVVLGNLFDSLSDSLTSFINNYVYKLSREDADREHPFGHGGYEVIASLIQGLVIAFLGLSLFVEVLRKILTGKHDYLAEYNFWFAISCLAFSALASLFINWYISRQIKQVEEANERSLVLLADKYHYTGDVWVNGLGALGLFLVYLTGIKYLDMLMGLVASIMLFSTSLPILKKCFRDIVHNEASPDLQQIIVDIVLKTDKRVKGLHALRSRELGPYLFVDFHLKVSSKMSIVEAHNLSDEVEENIKRILPRSDVLIHLDPETEPDQIPWDPSYSIPSNSNDDENLRK